MHFSYMVVDILEKMENRSLSLLLFFVTCQYKSVSAICSMQGEKSYN